MGAFTRESSALSPIVTVRREGAPPRAAVWCAGVLLGLLVVAGTYARWSHLGASPLAVDEYYFVQSIDNILEHGVPRYDTGGIYTRGLVPQYVTAAFVTLLSGAEWAYRVPAVLWNLGCLVLVYVYGRRFLSPGLAACVAAAFAVSSWNVEFARFARMYSAFQFLTLASLMAIRGAFAPRIGARRYLPHLLVVATTATHLLGVLLVPLLFTPLFGTWRTRFASRGSRAAFALAGVVAGGVCALLVQWDFRNLGVVDRFPSDYVAPGHWEGGPLRLPPFLPQSWSDSPAALLVAAVLLVAVALLGLVPALKRRKGVELHLWLTLALAAAVAQSFWLLGFCALVLILRHRVYRLGEQSNVTLAVLLTTCAVAIARVLQTALQAGGGIKPLALALWNTFLSWPDFHGSVLAPWSRELPLLGGLTALAALYLLGGDARRPWHRLWNRPWAILVYVVLCIAVLRAPYSSTRYFYFVYPLLLITLCAAVQRIVGAARHGRPSRRPVPALSGVLFLAIFLVSGDFHPRHLLGMGRPEAIYRLNRFERYSDTWYPRRDFANPARYLNYLAADGEEPRVVIFGQPPVSYYLDFPHAVFFGRKDRRYLRVCRERGTVDLWSNQRLLSTPAEIAAWARDADVVFAVLDVADRERVTKLIRRTGREIVEEEQVLASQDGRLDLRRYRLAPPRLPGRVSAQASVDRRPEAAKRSS